MELRARKQQILSRVIEDYIASAEPVGSKAIAQEMGGSVSSATVRNELAELSDLGYLEQPHTSAGRVPTPKGNRLYVNEQMERREVSEAEAEEINETLQDKMSAAGSMLSQAGQMASSIVDYPAYAVAEGKSGVAVKRFELLGVDDTSFITVVMTDDSRVKSQLQRSPLAFDRARLTDLSALLNTHFTKQSREEMSAKLMGLSDQIAPEHLEICVDDPVAVLNSVQNAGSIFLGKNVPEALGDYFAGPNHTLPTSGTARSSSPLGGDDFVKKASFIYYTREALGEVQGRIANYAEHEGIHAHAKSVTIRFEE